MTKSSNDLLLVTLGIAGLIGSFIILKHPYLGLGFIIALTPILQALPSISLFSSIAIPLGGLTLVSALIHIRNQHKPLQKRGMNIILIGLVFLCLIFIGELGREVDAERLWTLTYFQLILFVWLLGELITNWKQMIVIMAFFVFSSAISAISGLAQLNVDGWNGLYRVEGLSGNANEQSAYSAIAIIMCFAFLQVFKSKWLRYLILLISFILLLGFILSGSRGGMLFLVPSFLFMLVRIKGVKGSLKYVVIISLIFIIIYSILPSAYSSRIIDSFDIIKNADDTVGLRYKLWDLAFRAWQQAPVFGIGAGGFVPYVVRYLNIPGDFKIDVPHNMYLTVLAENGAVGLFLFMGIIGTSTMFFEKAKLVLAKYRYKEQIWVIAWEAILIFMLLMGLKGSIQYFRSLWMVFGFSLFFYRISHRILYQQLSQRVKNA